MKLKMIEIQGFKSFVDRTRLEFDEGITAILGPNGCGKSNVVDAIRWVLGEQSAKSLRGGKMDDVIFKGTTKRRPVGMASVTLVFNNEDHALPIEFDEVAIQRKVTRDGGSDYFLNGSPCRLKDLKDLFYDAGVNNASYSIIEESMIKQILNENNTELRRLLEEGSGITKYKARRKETQRKLDRTQNDLVRLYDIIEEIGREVRSLQRQVGKARRHQTLFKEIRNLDLLLAGRRHALMDNQEAEARENLETFRAQAEAGVGELAELQARIEAARPTIDERESERRHLQEALLAFEEELQETERKVLVMQHRVEEHQRRIDENGLTIRDAEVRQQELEGQIERMTVHLKTIEEELESSGLLLDEKSETLSILEDRLATDRTSFDNATKQNLEFIESDATQRSELRELQIKQDNRRERITILVEDRAAILTEGAAADTRLAEVAEEKQGVSGRRSELLAELADTERKGTDLEADGQALQEEVSACAARRQAAHSTVDLLQKLHDDYEGYGQGPREMLQRHGGEGRVTGGLADLIQVDSADTQALSILLDELLDAVVVDQMPSALDMVRELRDEDLGEVRFICSEGFNASGAVDFQSLGGRPARDAVTGAGADLPALKGLLERAAIFATDDEAVAAARTYTGPGLALCVSREGLLVGSDGTVRGGRETEADSGILGRQEKLKELRSELEDLEDRLVRAQEQVAANRSAQQDLRQALQAGRARLTELDDALGRLQVEAAQLEHTRATSGARAAEMEAESVRLEAEVAALANKEEELTDLLKESGRRRENSTLHRDELRTRMEEAELARDEARGEVEELRLTHQRRESQKRETETALSHLRENVAEQFARRERLAQEIEVSRESMGAMGEELVDLREILGKGMEERERRRQVVQASAEGIQRLHEETAEWHERVQIIEKQRGGFRDQAHEMETLLATLDVKRNNLEERVEEQYKGSYQDLIATVNEAELPKELEREGDVINLDQATQLLEDKRGRIGGLGPINHLALEEYDTKKERLEFLEGQRDDVEKARDDLVKAITEINRTAKKRFVATFEEVRRNYIAVFKTLFKGGRADLEMVKTDDPLESHLHITAQPTGKVIDTVSLLSGGERCLTALSLLFAVYLVKPSPFCVLDEADAPLDDANIGRFVNMLREFSRNTQFLVITHNKLTMETANHLYGVTMMEPGCSNIVSVSFNDVAESQSDRDLSNAIARRRQEVDSKEGPRVSLEDEHSGQESMDLGDVRVEVDHEILADEDMGAEAPESDPAETESETDDRMEASQ